MLIALQPARNAAKHARGLHALHWLGQWGFLGIFAVAVVDFSVIPLPLPNVTDLLLLWLVSHRGGAWILVPSAVAGGIMGAYTTWHVGWKGGRRVLQHYRSLPLLEPVFRWMERHPISFALMLPLFPPPIPLTPLVLACGAIGIPRKRFFAPFSVALGVRYVAIAWLAETYGRYVIRLWAAVLKKGSGPSLWILGAMLVSGMIWGLMRAFSRKRSALPKEQPGETLELQVTIADSNALTDTSAPTA